MKLNRFELAGICASIVLVALAAVFAISQTAYADDVDPCSLPGMVMLGCDNEEGTMETPVDPCEITPCEDDGPSLGEQITCEVYEDLLAQGEPIPQGFDASHCDPDEGNGGGGGSETHACDDGVDNDTDGKVDMDDPGCSDVNDNDETDPSLGGGSGGSGGGGGGGGGGGSGGGGGGSVEGSATTTEACDKYLTTFIKPGAKNDREQVSRLQAFLKVFEGASLDISGTYDAATIAAVHAFQTKYWETILAPWNIKQSTGYVYLTTRKKVNEIYCDRGITFPLSDEESKIIEDAKRAPRTVTATPAAAPAAQPAAKPAAKSTEPEKKQQPTTGSATRRSGWGTVGDFFRRLFNRGN